MSRDLLLMAFSLMTWGIGEGMYFYFQPLYLQQLGASPILIGSILGAMGVAMAIAHIPAGYLADRIGRRPIIWAAWLLGFLASVLMALAKNLPVFTAGMLAYGLTAFVSSPMNSYITAARGNMSVPRALTLISALYNTGAILGPWLGGLVGERFGLSIIYRFSAGFFLLSTLIILFIRSQPVEQYPTEAHLSGKSFSLNFRQYLGIVFFAMFAMYLAQPLSSNFLQNVRSIQVAQIGWLGSIASLGNVIFNLILGSLPARVGFLLGQASAALFALIIWRGTGFPWYAVGYFLLGGFRAARMLMAAQVRSLVHPSRMGLAYGITETIALSAVIIASPIAGVIFEAQPASIYMAGLALILLSILISARFKPASV